MKIRNSSRITAIVLALMMIVPLISVPTFALDASENFNKSAAAGELIWSADFEDADALSDVYSTTGSLAQLKDIGGEHGKVYYNDNKPATVYKDGNTYFAATTNTNKATVYGIKNVDISDGKLSGTFTANNKTYWLDSVAFGTNDFGDVVTAKQVNVPDGETAATLDVYPITAEVWDARCGFTNIAKENNVAVANKNIQPATEGGSLVFVADYYFSSDFNSSMDLRMNTQNKNVDWGRIDVSGTGLTLDLHGDIDTAANGGVITKNYTEVFAKGEWVTIAFALTPTTGDVFAYVNGDLAAYGNIGNRTFADEITGGTGWNLGHTPRGNAVSAYQGYWMVDNLRIYNGDYGAWTTDAIYRKAMDTATSVDSIFTYNANDTISTTYGGQNVSGHWHASWTQGDANGKGYPSGGNVNTNLTLNEAMAYSYTNYDSLVFEADYYLPAVAQYDLILQFKNITGDWYGNDETMADLSLQGTAQANKAWIQISTIRVTGGKVTSISAGNAYDNNATVKSYDFNIATGQWVTISTVLNLDTGWIQLYFDGQIVREWQLNHSTATTGYVKNITVPAGASGWMLAKLADKTSAFNDSGYYKGDMLIDNVSIYKSETPHCLETTPDYITYGGNDWLDTDGSTFSNSQYNATGNPTITHNAAPDGTPALQFTLGLDPSTSKTVDFAYIAGPNSRVYKIDTTTTKMAEDFDPKSIATTQAGVTAIATKTGSGTGGTSSTDKIIYYALNHDGTKAYVWNTNFSYYGVKDVAQPITEGDDAGKYDSTVWYAGAGDNNIDRYVQFKAPEYTKDTHGTVVFNTSYYVDDAACGTVESQIHGTGSNGTKVSYYNVYQLNLEYNTFYLTGAKKTANLEVDAWNRVTIVVDMTNHKVTAYLNGVYVGEQAYNFDLIPANSYIVAKCMKAWEADAYKLTGNYWIGEFSSDAYDASNVYEVNASQIVNWNVDGFKYTNYVAGTTKIYSEDSYKGITAAEYYADFADMILTEQAASIRLTKPNTGLRFGTKIDVDALAELKKLTKNVTYGTIIAPEDNYTESALTFEALVENDAAGCIRVEATDGMYYTFDDNDATTHFVGSIVGIKEQNMDRAFSGRGYVEITLANGNVYHIYSDSIKSISVADQAAATIEAYEQGKIQLTDDQLATVEEFAAYANAN